MLEKFFHLKENHTDVKTEIMAGITTFMTMAYILAVNPNILSAAGMDSKAVLIATALASFIATALMAVLANYPFALAPGMGLNAYFAYTVVLTMGYSWQLALMAVFVEGVIFIALSLTNVREGIFNAIPMTLKSAVSVGIGLFVAFVGLQNAKLIVNSDSTLVTYQHFKGETFHSIGVGAILALVGVLITAILLVKKVKGGILYGILITWLLGIVCELTGIYVPDVEAGMYSVIPTAFVSFDFSALGETFGQVFKTDFSGVGLLNFFAVMFSFLFVDLFDTLGTLIGVASKADMLDEDGRLPHIKGALMADSIGTCVGAVLGTSTTTTFVESASGVTEGGRTGLTAMTTGVLFLLATHLIIVKGVEKGIEKSAKIMMPMLFVLLIILAICSISLPGAGAGIEFLLKPDFSKVDGNVFLGAMGQAFFSLSLGMGCLCTYASYFRNDTNLPKTALNVAAIDTMVAILAGFIIFPAAFSVGIKPDAGPSLLFITLPNVFQQAFGNIPWLAILLSLMFYILLALAALTSTISLHEVVTAYLHEEFNFTRGKAARLVTGGCIFLGILCSLSLGVMKGFTVFGLGIFDLFDFVTAKIMLTLGGLCISIFTGWYLDKKIVWAEITNDGSLKVPVYKLIIFILRYIAPIAISLIFINELGLIKL